MITDSEYVKNGITQWIHGWKRKGWMTSAKKPVVNSDLWRELDEAVSRHKTTWTWTKGHASHDDNNRATNWPLWRHASSGPATEAVRHRAVTKGVVTSRRESELAGPLRSGRPASRYCFPRRQPPTRRSPIGGLEKLSVT